MSEHFSARRPRLPPGEAGGDGGPAGGVGRQAGQRVVAALLCAFSLFLMVHHSGAEPECAGKPMQPGDVCRSVGRGTSRTYEETRQSLADSVPIDRTLAVVSGAVFLTAGAYNRLARRAPSTTRTLRSN